MKRSVVHCGCYLVLLIGSGCGATDDGSTMQGATGGAAGVAGAGGMAGASPMGGVGGFGGTTSPTAGVGGIAPSGGQGGVGGGAGGMMTGGAGGTGVTEVPGERDRGASEPKAPLMRWVRSAWLSCLRRPGCRGVRGSERDAHLTM